MVKKHTGGCHCGAVRYEVETDISQVVSCNCSVCNKRGSLLTFVGEPQFKLKSGEENLVDYKFNKHVISHLFCKTCGILSFARGKDEKGNIGIAINVRCIDDVDVDALQCIKYDGKAL